MHSITSGYSFAEGLDLEDVFDIKAASSEYVAELFSLCYSNADIRPKFDGISPR